MYLFIYFVRYSVLYVNRPLYFRDFRTNAEVPKKYFYTILINKTVYVVNPYKYLNKIDDD